MTTETRISLINEMTDVTAPKHVEILIRSDSKMVWVNVDGVCLFRACRIESLQVTDDRKTRGALL